MVLAYTSHFAFSYNYIYHTELQTRSDVLELLHHLLQSAKGVRILKFSLEGGVPTADIVSGLEILTAIFGRYGEFECKLLGE